MALINLRLSSSASISESILLFAFLCDVPVVPTLVVGEPLSRPNAAPAELVLARRTVPDSGVYRCACFAGREECLEDEEVPGGVMPLTFSVAGGVFSASVWVDSGGETSDVATCCVIMGEEGMWFPSASGSYFISEKGEVAIRFTSSSGLKVPSVVAKVASPCKEGVIDATVSITLAESTIVAEGSCTLVPSVSSASVATNVRGGLECSRTDLEPSRDQSFAIMPFVFVAPGDREAGFFFLAAGRGTAVP